MTHGDVLWTPPVDIREHSQIGRYLAGSSAETGRTFEGYHDLWQWSVDDLPGFWGSVWDYADARATRWLPTACSPSDRCPGPGGSPT